MTNETREKPDQSEASPRRLTKIQLFVRWMSRYSLKSLFGALRDRHPESDEFDSIEWLGEEYVREFYSDGQLVERIRHRRYSLRLALLLIASTLSLAAYYLLI